MFINREIVFATRAVITIEEDHWDIQFELFVGLKCRLF